MVYYTRYLSRTRKDLELLIGIYEENYKSQKEQHGRVEEMIGGLNQWRRWFEDTLSMLKIENGEEYIIKNNILIMKEISKRR